MPLSRAPKSTILQPDIRIYRALSTDAGSTRPPTSERKSADRGDRRRSSRLTPQSFRSGYRTFSQTASMRLNEPTIEQRCSRTAQSSSRRRVQRFGLRERECEIYDPITETFTATEAMSIARAAHTSTLLANVRCSSRAAFRVAWQSPGCDCRTLRSGTERCSNRNHERGTPTFTATLLPQWHRPGQGGETPASSATASAELYDPQSGTFASTGTMSTARSDFIAGLLPSGRSWWRRFLSPWSPMEIAWAEIYHALVSE